MLHKECRLDIRKSVSHHSVQKIVVKIWDKINEICHFENTVFKHFTACTVLDTNLLARNLLLHTSHSIETLLSSSDVSSKSFSTFFSVVSNWALSTVISSSLNEKKTPNRLASSVQYSLRFDICARIRTKFPGWIQNKGYFSYACRVQYLAPMSSPTDATSSFLRSAFTCNKHVID